MTLDFGTRRPRPEELDLASIALHYPVKTVGDGVALGDVVCISMEDQPSARIVGFLKSDQPGMRTIIRCFAAGDGWIPTGEYRRCGMYWPWHGHAEARRKAAATGGSEPNPSKATAQSAPSEGSS